MNTPMHLAALANRKCVVDIYKYGGDLFLENLGFNDNFDVLDVLNEKTVIDILIKNCK